MLVSEVVAELGGVARRMDLERYGCSADQIYLAVNYRNVIKVRRGVYASTGTSPLIVRALRVGGRLACLSALEYYGLAEPQPHIHVEVKANASRLRIEQRGVVVHWTRLPQKGSPLVVSPDRARVQTLTCRDELHLDEHRRVEKRQYVQQ